MKAESALTRLPQTLFGGGIIVLSIRRIGGVLLLVLAVLKVIGIAVVLWRGDPSRTNLWIVRPKAFLDGCRWDAETRERIDQHLFDTEMVAILSYHTSDTQPEPLAGHGKTFDFLIQPDTLDVIHTSTGLAVLTGISGL